jgi:hypothetical protein
MAGGGSPGLGDYILARVNVEESAFVMARRLAFQMGWDEDQALGKLTRFWHDSQAEEVAECEATDIAVWFKVDQTEAMRLLDALVNAKAVLELEDGRYRIRGNAKHIDNLKQRKEAAAIGGRKSGLVRAGKIPKDINDDEANASTEREANASTEAERLLEPRTEQNRAEQSKKNVPSPSRAPVFDLEEIYRGFPKRDGSMGKKRGMDLLRRQIKTPEDFENLRRAVDHYAQHVARHRAKDPGWCYSVQWSTFASPTSDGTWLDWVEPDSSPTRPQRKLLTPEEIAQLEAGGAYGGT